MWRPGKRHLPAALQSGPTLPARLVREIGGDGAGTGGSVSHGGSGGGRGGAPRPAAGGSAAAARKARRKAERQEKAQRRAQHAAPRPRDGGDGGAAMPARPPPAGAQRTAPPAAAAAPKRLREGDDGAPPRKRPAPDAPAPRRADGGEPATKKAKIAKTKAKAAPPPTAEQLRLRREIEAELRLQRQLNKKLKGRTKGPDDGLSALLAGLTQPAALDEEEEESEGGSDEEDEGAEDEVDDGFDEDAFEEDDEDASDGSDGEPAAAPAAPARYVPPAARAAAAAAASGADAADERLARRVRGLLNRLGEANATAVTSEVAGLLSEGYTRRAVGGAAVTEVISALVRGPRASGAYACALATFVAGLCALGLGPDLGARALAAAAAALDEARAGEGDSRAVANVGALVARLYLAGLVPPALLWGMLCHVTAALGEADVALTLAVLRAAGPRLRADDPAGLRDFIISLQERSAAAQQAAGAAAGTGEGGLSQRARLLLELVCDLKNGKRGAKLGAAGGGGEDFPPALLRWLRDADVAAPATALASLTWRKLLDAPSHRGAWWLPAPGGVNDDAHGEDADGTRRGGAGALHGSSAAAAAAAAASAESAALLARAASLRMNTDARRAVFCALMSAEDCADAAERLLRLPLAGGQEREVPRVLLECCLQEAAYNPFYELTAARLAAGSKRHRTTLQFAVWDRWKELATADARRLSHLARFCAGALARGALPLGALRGAELAEAAAPGAPPRRVAHFKLLLTHLICPPAGGARTLRDVHALLLRAAGRPALAGLRAGLLLFMKAHLLTPGAGGDAPAPAMRAAVRAAEAALNGESMAEDAPR